MDGRGGGAVGVEAIDDVGVCQVSSMKGISSVKRGKRDVVEVITQYGNHAAPVQHWHWYHFAAPCECFWVKVKPGKERGFCCFPAGLGWAYIRCTALVGEVTIYNPLVRVRIAKAARVSGYEG